MKFFGPMAEEPMAFVFLGGASNVFVGIMHGMKDNIWVFLFQGYLASVRWVLTGPRFCQM